ncbi:hypothetical protein H0H87_008670, partial [Tephrocybe sp. NHM501043]
MYPSSPSYYDDDSDNYGGPTPIDEYEIVRLAPAIAMANRGIHTMVWVTDALRLAHNSPFSPTTVLRLVVTSEEEAYRAAKVIAESLPDKFRGPVDGTLVRPT